jgi:ABC-2 type transport system ATP-binding protein
MEEADELCDRVAIIDHGKILVQDTPTALKGSVGAQKVYELYLRSHENIPTLIQQLQQLSGVASVEPTPKGVRVLAQGTEGLLSDVVREANSYGLRDLAITETSLETVFIQLTGRDLRE